MIKIKEFIKRVKGFISENPKRAKFVGLIVVAVTLPLIVVAALTVQNLQQKASESDVLRIADASGNTLTETTNPSVYIELNLPPNWVLPNQQSSTLVKKAYAASACWENCMDAGFLSASQCSKNCGEDVPAPVVSTPTSAPIPTATSIPTVVISPTLAPTVPVTTPAVTNSCESLNSSLYKCASSCGSLGIGWDKQTNFDVSCPNNQQCCYYQAPPVATPTPTSSSTNSGVIKHILKRITIQNIDSQEVIEARGNAQKIVEIGPGDQLPNHIEWKLNDFFPSDPNVVDRVVKVIFISTGTSTDRFFAEYERRIILRRADSTSGSTVIQSGSSVIQSGSSVFTQFQEQDLDLNNDNRTDDVDVEFIVSQFGKKGRNAADLTGDGIVSGEDINQYLRAKKDLAQ